MYAFTLQAIVWWQQRELYAVLERLKRNVVWCGMKRKADDHYRVKMGRQVGDIGYA